MSAELSERHWLDLVPARPGLGILLRPRFAAVARYAEAATNYAIELEIGGKEIAKLNRGPTFGISFVTDGDGLKVSITPQRLLVQFEDDVSPPPYSDAVELLLDRVLGVSKVLNDTIPLSVEGIGLFFELNAALDDQMPPGIVRLVENNLRNVLGVTPASAFNGQVSTTLAANGPQRDVCHHSFSYDYEGEDLQLRLDWQRRGGLSANKREVRAVVTDASEYFTAFSISDFCGSRGEE